MIGVAALAAAPVAGLGMIGAPPAGAHDVLVATAPEDGSVVTEPPGIVELTFTNAVQNQFAQVAVLDSTDTPYQQGEPEVVGPTVTQQVGDMPDGEYTVSYRIISSDGHPVSGTFSFSVAAGAGGEPSPTTTPTTTPTATPEVTPTPTTAASAESDEGISTPVVMLVVAAAAIAIAGIAFVAAGGRGRGSPRDTDS